MRVDLLKNDKNYLNFKIRSIIHFLKNNFMLPDISLNLSSSQGL